MQTERRLAVVGSDYGPLFQWAMYSEVSRMPRKTSQEKRFTFATSEHLSPAELRIFILVCDEMTNREIAEHLFVCVKTVKFHMTSIYKKLGVMKREQVLELYKRRKLPRDLRGRMENSAVAVKLKVKRVIPMETPDDAILPLGGDPLVKPEPVAS